MDEYIRADKRRPVALFRANINAACLVNSGGNHHGQAVDLAAACAHLARAVIIGIRGLIVAEHFIACVKRRIARAKTHLTGTKPDQYQQDDGD